MKKKNKPVTQPPNKSANLSRMLPNVPTETIYTLETPDLGNVTCEVEAVKYDMDTQDFDFIKVRCLDIQLDIDVYTKDVIINFVKLQDNLVESCLFSGEQKDQKIYDLLKTLRIPALLLDVVMVELNIHFETEFKQITTTDYYRWGVTVNGRKYVSDPDSVSVSS